MNKNIHDIETPTNQIIDTTELRNWLETGKPVALLDVRTAEQHAEWKIPGSIHIDVYEKLKQNDPTTFDNIELDKTIPVITFCNSGRMSLTASALLQSRGYNAFSLEGGMKAWSLAWNTATILSDEFELIQFRRTGKGCLSYMIISGNEAAVVDASLNIEVYEQLLQTRKASLKYVIETHIHADHLSRSKQLADNNPGSILYLPANNKLHFSFAAVAHNTTLALGSISIEAIFTPGHTTESTSYLVDDKFLLTGDTLFVNSVGRPDLKASDAEAREKAKMLYGSLRKILELDDQTIVLPGHTSKPADFDHKMIQTTIDHVKSNVELLQLNEDAFVQTILQRIPPAPFNYLLIAEKNTIGNFNDINPTDLEAGANRCAIS